MTSVSFLATIRNTSEDFIPVMSVNSFFLCPRDSLGLLKDFTGIDSAYEIPKNPEITLDGEKYTADELSDKIINYLSENKILKL